jgi:ligand-binding sensor domain-containing protein
VQASRVNGLTTTADALWLCTAFRGVLSWNGTSTLTSHQQPGDAGRQCSSILADRQDRVWAGFGGGGVTLYEHGTARALTERDGLAPGSVWQIVQGDDDAVWFATSGGVSRYRTAASRRSRRRTRRSPRSSRCWSWTRRATSGSGSSRAPC